jgi:hypothetical protein
VPEGFDHIYFWTDYKTPRQESNKRNENFLEQKKSAGTIFIPANDADKMNYFCVASVNGCQWGVVKRTGAPASMARRAMSTASRQSRMQCHARFA